MMFEMTREELYGAVWQRPATKVAAELGISGVALGKICRRHNIPVPGRGYWARLNAGQTLEQSRLPPRPGEKPSVIRIRGRRDRPNGEANSNDLEARLHRLVEASNRHDVDAAPISVYAVRLQKRLSRRKADGVGLLHITDTSLFRVCVTAASVDRVVALIDRLCHLAEAAGFKIQSSDAGAGFVTEGQFIAIQVTEALRKNPHELTETERNKLDRSKINRRPDKTGRFDGRWQEPKLPRWDFMPSGRLEIRIDDGSHRDGLRRKFADGQTQRLERLLPKVISGIATCAHASVARKQEQARREEQHRSAELRYREAQRREALENKRIEVLEKVKGDWLAARSIDAFLAAFYRHHHNKTLPVAVRRFLEWSAQRAELLREKSSVLAIAEVLERLDLMNDQATVHPWVRIQ